MLGPPPEGDGRRRRRVPRELRAWPCHSSPCSPAQAARLVRRRCWNRICHKGSRRLPGSGRAGIGPGVVLGRRGRGPAWLCLCAGFEVTPFLWWNKRRKGEKARELGFLSLRSWNPRPRAPAAGMGVPVRSDSLGATHPRDLLGRRRQAREQWPGHACPWAGRPVRHTHCGRAAWAGSCQSEPLGFTRTRLPLQPGCVMGNPVLTQKGTPSFAFLSDFLILLAMWQHGTGLGHTGPAWSRGWAAEWAPRSLGFPTCKVVPSPLPRAGMHSICPVPGAQQVASPVRAFGDLFSTHRSLLCIRRSRASVTLTPTQGQMSLLPTSSVGRCAGWVFAG